MKESTYCNEYCCCWQHQSKYKSQLSKLKLRTLLFLFFKLERSVVPIEWIGWTKQTSNCHRHHTSQYLFNCCLLLFITIYFVSLLLVGLFAAQHSDHFAVWNGNKSTISLLFVFLHLINRNRSKRMVMQSIL